MLPHVFSLLALPVLSAGVAPGGFTLDWKVPCAPAPETSELVGAAEGRAEVEVTPDGARWSLVVRFVAPGPAERRLQTETCEEAAQVAALLLRLGGRAQPARSSRTFPVPAVADAPRPSAGAAVEPPNPVRLSLGLQALAQAGALPSVVPRFGVSFGVDWAEHWAALVSVRLGGPTEVPAGTSTARLVLVEPMLGAQASLCWQAVARRFTGGPCAVIQAEAWQVRSVNVTAPRSGTAVFAASGVDARGAVRLWSNLSLSAAVGVRVALSRPRVFFSDTGTVFQSSSLTAEGELGVRWAW